MHKIMKSEIDQSPLEMAVSFKRSALVTVGHWQPPNDQHGKKKKCNELRNPCVEEINWKSCCQALGDPLTGKGGVTVSE